MHFGHFSFNQRDILFAVEKKHFYQQQNAASSEFEGQQLNGDWEVAVPHTGTSQRAWNSFFLSKIGITPLQVVVTLAFPR